MVAAVAVLALLTEAELTTQALDFLAVVVVLPLEQMQHPQPLLLAGAAVGAITTIAPVALLPLALTA